MPSTLPSPTSSTAPTRRPSSAAQASGMGTLNNRLVALLRAGQTPVVESLLAMGSNPYEPLSCDVLKPMEPPTTERDSVFGWALRTGLDDEAGTPALNRLHGTMLAMITSRRTATQAVTRWDQNEWDDRQIASSNKPGILRWSLHAQAEILTRAMPLVEPALIEQVGLAKACVEGVVNPDALRDALHRRLLQDLLTRPLPDASMAVGLECVQTVLPEDAWALMLNDPLPVPENGRGEVSTPIPLPWVQLVTVRRRWSILAGVPVDLAHRWLTHPFPDAMKTGLPDTMMSGCPFAIRTPFDLVLVSYAHGLTTPSLHGDQPALASLGQIVWNMLQPFTGSPETMPAWDLPRLTLLADAIARWENWPEHRTGPVVRPSINPASLRQLRIAMEPPLLVRTVNQTVQDLPSRARSRL